MTDALPPRPLRGLVVGVANDKSIAWGCAQAFTAMGAQLAVTYQNDKTREFTEPLADNIKVDIFMPLDVTDPAQMDAVFAKISQEWGGLDFILHSVAFAPTPDLQGRVIDCSPEAFAMAMDVSCHSLVRLAKHAEPLMLKGGSILTMSYYGSEKVMPYYNMMGPVKAALESTVRYLAWELGMANIRVNALSPGPIRTRAASGLGHFDEMMSEVAEKTPLHSSINIAQIGETAAFMISERASGISGQVIYVDNGYSSVG